MQQADRDTGHGGAVMQSRRLMMGNLAGGSSSSGAAPAPPRPSRGVLASLVLFLAICWALGGIPGCGSENKTEGQPPPGSKLLDTMATKGDPGDAAAEQPLASVRLGDKWGFINKQGRMVIAPQFDEVRHFD